MLCETYPSSPAHPRGKTQVNHTILDGFFYWAHGPNFYAPLWAHWILEGAGDQIMLAFWVGVGDEDGVAVGVGVWGWVSVGVRGVRHRGVGT